MKNQLQGQKFNCITVISDSGKRDKKNGSILWECKCDCGNICLCYASPLRRGLVKSCGCIKARNLKQGFGSKHNGWKGYGEIFGTRWGAYKISAKRRKLEFNISIEYAYSLFLKQNKLCALTGEPIYFVASGRNIGKGENTASLDRIDNNLGYVEGNVQWVHTDINFLKGTLSEEELIKWCELISKNNP